MVYQYLCTYCPFKCQNHNEILEHACQNHSEKTLQYRKFVLNANTAKFGYSRFLFRELIPAELAKRGKTLKSDDSTIVIVTLHSQNTPHSKKRYKAATPCRESAKQDDTETLQFQASRSSSRKLPFSPDGQTASDVQFGDNTYVDGHTASDAQFDDNTYVDGHTASDVQFDDNTYVDGHTASDVQFDDNTYVDGHTASDVQFDDSIYVDDCKSLDVEKDLKELQMLLPSVVENLRKEGKLDFYKKYCKLLANGTFPHDNICYLLFLDLVEWYSHDTSTEMRYYFPDTVQFWRIGYKLFKGKFIRFMGGPKSSGQVINESGLKGNLSTELSKVNFVIPSVQILMDKGKTLSDFRPGILEDALQSVSVSSQDKPLKLSVDGKKIARGRGKSMGDVDCWSFEPSPTLVEQRERLKTEIHHAESLFSQLDSMNTLSTTTLLDVLFAKDSLIAEVQTLVQMIGKRLLDLRAMKLSTERTTEKFLRIAGENWSKCRFFPLISSLRTTRYDIDKHIEDGLLLVNKLVYYGSILNNSEEHCSLSDTIFLPAQSNYVPLNQFEGDINNPQEWRFVNQRSEEWFNLRKQAKVTGSTINAAVGLDTLKKQQEHYDCVMYGKQRPQFTSKQTENMTFGVVNEINAVATTVAKIMPLYYPNLTMFGEGCEGIMLSGEPFMIVSPDGSIRSSKDTHPVLMYEAKCRPPKELTTPVYYILPRYYVLQVLSEMRAYGCSKLLFTCWSPESTVAIEISFSGHIWQQAWDELLAIFDSASPKRPSRVSAAVRTLRSDVCEFLGTSCRFLGEFPSVKCMSQQVKKATNCEKYSMSKIDNVLRDIQTIKRWLNNAHELTRKEATEILVFMLADLDRHFQMERENAIPVAYALKGSSMSNDIFRKMVDYVISECESKGLTIGVTSADGQWHRFGVRDASDKPLTKYQLQRDVSAKVRKKTKNDIIRELKEINKVDPTRILEHVAYEKKNCRIDVTGHLLFDNVPKLRPGIKLRCRDGSPNTSITDATNTDLDVIENLLIDIRDEFQTFDAGFIDTLDSVQTCTNMPSSITDDTCSDALGEAFRVLYQDTMEYTTESNEVEMSNTRVETVVEPRETEMELEVTETIGIDASFQQASSTASAILSEDDIHLMKTEIGKLRNPKRPDWEAMTLDAFKDKFRNAVLIEKTFVRPELLCALRVVIGKLKCNGIKCKLSSSKTELVNLFSKVLGDTSEVQLKKKKLTSPQYLRVLCSKLIQENYTKDSLNVIMSEYEWRKSELQKWKSENCSNGYILSNKFVANIDWFSVPSVYNGEVRFHFTDPSHILTCLRTKLCTTGIKGLDIKARETAALSDETNLNISMIVECIDKHSVAFAKAVFAEDVQNIMLQNGFQKEAYFSKCVCRWFEAEDLPGIPADNRCKRRLELRDWLLDGVNFNLFPPPQGCYIKGIPVTTYEAILVHIERKIQMYAYVTEGYNVRAIGTLDVEQFFGTFRDMDPSGSGTPKPDDIPMMMARATEITNCRLDPTRKFHMRTSKATVYPEVVFSQPESKQLQQKWKPPTSLLPFIITPSDHFFDTEERIRVSRKKKKTDTISSPRKPSLGVKGVREFHRCDESKILAHYRRGIRELPF